MEQIDRVFQAANLNPHILGVVFQWSSKEVPDGDLVVEHAPDAVYSEMFRQVRTGFQFATQSYPGKAYVLTSVGPQEGKSTMISNLGAALAQGGSRVILVDSDLRRPTLYRFVKLDRRPGGLSTVIANGQSPLVHLRETTVPHLRALLSGPVPANPADLLGSPRMEQVIDDLKGDSDYVLLDSPPIMAAADSTILASKVDGVVLVVTLRETRVDTSATPCAKSNVLALLWSDTLLIRSSPAESAMAATGTGTSTTTTTATTTTRKLPMLATGPTLERSGTAQRRGPG